jgi:hypothetical protein
MAVPGDAARRLGMASGRSVRTSHSPCRTPLGAARPCAVFSVAHRGPPASSVQKNPWPDTQAVVEWHPTGR